MRRVLTPFFSTPTRLAATAALCAMLLLPGPRANAASEYDVPAYDYLATGYAYAFDAYEFSGTFDSYCALCYAEYAEYYAALAYDYDDPLYWIYAESLATNAFDYALADYFATGNIWSLYTAYYFYFGADYAAYAFDYFE